MQEARIPLASLKKDDLVWRATHKCAHRHTYLVHPRCYIEEVGGRRLRTGYLDIEATALTGDMGIILSWNILGDVDDNTLLGDIITRADMDKSDNAGIAGIEDHRVVQTLLEGMAKFDLVVGYYSTGYDIPVIRTRSIINKLEFPEYGALLHADAYYSVKFKTKLLSNKQEHAARALLGKTRKTQISWPVWRAAGRGHPEALKEVSEHNVADVMDLRDIHRALTPYKKPLNRSV